MSSDLTPDQTARKGWMSLLAKAPEGRATDLAKDASLTAAFDWLRPPEIGSVMVRGRTGGTGAPFNLGEMTVTRASLRLASGEVGHGYVQGRRKACAETAAMLDALMQTEAADQVQSAVLSALEAEAEAAVAACKARERPPPHFLLTSALLSVHLTLYLHHFLFGRLLFCT